MSGLVPFNKHLSTDYYSNMIDNFFRDIWSAPGKLIGNSFKVDVREDEKEYTIEADMPGVKKEEVKLAINDGSLTISVIRDEEASNDSEGYTHRERHYSSMQRSLYLTDASDENIAASLNNGVLKITVPKQARMNKDKRIEIQ